MEVGTSNAQVYNIIHCSATKTERYFHVRTQSYKT